MPAEDGRAFDMEISINAPVDAVWKALADADELMRWFPLQARVKPGEGGSVFVSWGPDCEGEAPITVWDPPRRFQWTEHMPGGEGGPPVPITVEFQLEGQGGSTVLRLVHSGMGAGDNWDGYFDSISRGWKFELRGLRHYLEQHRGEDRVVTWVRQRTELPKEEAFARIIGEQGGVLHGAITGLVEGDAYRLKPAAGEGEMMAGTVQVNNPPGSFVGTVDGLNRAYLRIELENMGKGNEVWLWLSTYGVPEARRVAIEAEWRAALTASLA